MRNKLKQARLSKNMTQADVAEKIDVEPHYYNRIERGNVIGGCWIWDALEDLFGINQRELRENT